MEVDQSIGIRTDTVVDRVLLYVASGLFALTVLLATVQVFVRQTGILPSQYFTWTVPVARFLLIIMTYVGGAVVTRNGEHISIDVMLDWFAESRPRTRATLSALSRVVVIAFLAMAVYGAGISTVENWSTSVGGVQGITSGYIYSGIAVGLFFMLLYEVQDLVETVSALTHDDAGIEEATEDV